MLNIFFYKPQLFFHVFLHIYSFRPGGEAYLTVLALQVYCNEKKEKTLSFQCNATSLQSSSFWLAFNQVLATMRAKSYLKKFCKHKIKSNTN